MKIIFIFLLCGSAMSASSVKTRMPLLANNLRSHLYAELDISAVNEQIKDYIDVSVENQVNDTFQTKIEHFVNNKISELKAEMLKDFSNNMKETKDKYENELSSAVNDATSEITRQANNSMKAIDELNRNWNENAKWKESVTKEIRELSIKLEEVKAHSIFDKPVALTSCVVNESNISPDATIKFKDVVQQIGFDGISQFKKTGKFTCEKPGPYLISVHITSTTVGAGYSILKNGNVLSKVFIGDRSSDEWWFTGTGLVTVELHISDHVWVQSNININANMNRYSCMSIVKIK